MAQSGRYETTQPRSALQLTPTDSAIMSALGDWMSTVLPSGWAIVQGQQNRTPPPTPPFATMQTISRKRIATNNHVYQGQSVTIIQPLILTIQVTLFGVGAADGVVVLNTAWNDPDAAAFFRKTLPQAAPLYSAYPQQDAFTTAEKQYEESWSLDLSLNINAQITRPIESATELDMPAAYIIGADRTHKH